MAFKFETKLGLSDIINIILGGIGIWIAVRVGFNTDQLAALNKIVSNNTNQLNALNKLVSSSNQNLNTLKNLLTSNQQQLLNNQQSLSTNQKNLAELNNAVKGIIMSNTQLKSINNKLQSQTDSLIKQTTLLAKSVEINNQILSRHNHDDSARFINASYELEDLLNKIVHAFGPVYYISDSLKNIKYIDSTLKLFNVGLTNYCVNDNRDLFTGWRTAIGQLNYLKETIKSGYPNAIEFKQIGNEVFNSEWQVKLTQFKDDGQYLDNLLDDLQKILIETRTSYEIKGYADKISIFR